MDNGLLAHGLEQGPCYLFAFVAELHFRGSVKSWLRTAALVNCLAANKKLARSEFVVNLLVKGGLLFFDFKIKVKSDQQVKRRSLLS